jgi:hypothetical protein
MSKGDTMTETVHSIDGITITRRYRDAPKWHWVADTATGGHYVAANVATGYYPLDRTDRPADNAEGTHDHAIVRDGDRFIETWTHRPWTADEIAARTEEARRAAAYQWGRELLDDLVAWARSTDDPTADEVALASILTPAAIDALLDR